MKFTIEIDEESLNEDFAYEISQAIAYKVMSKMDIEGMVKKANAEIKNRKSKEETKIISKFTKYDKNMILFDLMQYIQPSVMAKVKKEIKEELLKTLINDDKFIAKISTSIIKSKLS